MQIYLHFDQHFDVFSQAGNQKSRLAISLELASELMEKYFINLSWNLIEIYHDVVIRRSREGGFMYVNIWILILEGLNHENYLKLY